MTFKIATWNVNSLRVRLAHVLAFLSSNQPDVLVLQEIKLVNEDFPHEAFQEAGYQAIVSGQKTYNGVAIISKKEATHIATDIPTLDDPQRRVLSATIDGMRIINLYVPNGEDTTSAKYEYKLNWLEHLNQYLQKELVNYPNTIVLGDFNIAPHDIDVYDPKRFQGKLLCSEPERSLFQQILAKGFKDCFRLLSPDEKMFSWWDYRLSAYQRNWGVRIDHILASLPFASQCKNCYIDTHPRGLERPSDHAPVIAEFNIAI